MGNPRNTTEAIDVVVLQGGHISNPLDGVMQNNIIHSAFLLTSTTLKK